MLNKNYIFLGQPISSIVSSNLNFSEFTVHHPDRENTLILQTAQMYNAYKLVDYFKMCSKMPKRSSAGSHIYEVYRSGYSFHRPAQPSMSLASL